ncbi:glycosyltransferase [Streptomyces sp. 4N509B]|uniref:glycosyltransferase n=1 Tax=Streptomyces sp. 4N509B TaxID=3457413 RepID=UPI003FD10D65
MKIVFLVTDTVDVSDSGRIDPTARATAALAAALRQDGQGPRVELATVADAGPWRAALDEARAEQVDVVPVGPDPRRLDAFLRRTDADVVIASDPGLVAALAEHGHSRYVRIGQEHRGLHALGQDARDRQLAAIPELDAFVTFSETDAARHRAALPEGAATRVVAIRGCVPASGLAPASGSSRVIIAAGPLTPDRGYDRLIDAFAKVASQRPGWSLRIHGGGSLAEPLQRRIDELGLYNRIRLMGPLPPAEKMETEWIKGAIAAVSTVEAAGESVGLTALEAMRCGLPVVTTDCACGPAEVVTHGLDGLLVPVDGGSDALAAALLRLIDHPDERQAMAEAALATAARHNPAGVARRYVALAEELLRHSGHRARWLRGALARAAAPATRMRPVAARPARAPRTRGRCVVGDDGSLAVELDAATLPVDAGQLDFVAEQREAPGGRQRIRIPIRRRPGQDASPHVTVVLERSARVLPEGRWDCYVEPRDEGQRRRVAADAIDAAALVTLPPTVDEHGVACWLPYTTSEGDLSLRTWLRRAHAEVEQILVGEESLTVTVALLGPGLRGHGAGARGGSWGTRGQGAGEARAVATSRSRGGGELSVPLRMLPPAAGRRGHATRAEFAVRYEDVLVRRGHGGRDVWDLRLEFAGSGGCGVPVGRISGDSINRTNTESFPAVVRGGTRLRPFFTAPHGLALSTESVVSEPPAASE